MTSRVMLSSRRQDRCFAASRSPGGWASCRTSERSGPSLLVADGAGGGHDGVHGRARRGAPDEVDREGERLGEVEQPEIAVDDVNRAARRQADAALGADDLGPGVVHLRGRAGAWLEAAATAGLDDRVVVVLVVARGVEREG